MAWRLISIPDGKAQENDLTNVELVGISIILTHYCGEPEDNVEVEPQLAATGGER